MLIRLSRGPSADGGSFEKSLPTETVTVSCPDHLVRHYEDSDNQDDGGDFNLCCPSLFEVFPEKTEFESHIHDSHADVLQPNAEKEDGKESEVQSAKQFVGSESTLRAPSRAVFSPGSDPQLHDNEDTARRLQTREQLPPRPIMQLKAPPICGPVPSDPTEPQPDNSQPPGSERPGTHHFQQSFDRQGTPQPESSQFSEKQQGHMPENHFPKYPYMHSMQPPNFNMPVNSNPVLPPYGIHPFSTNRAQPFYTNPYEVARPNSPPDVTAERGSLLGYPPGPMGGLNYSAAYPQRWNAGQPGVSFEASAVNQGMVEGSNAMDPWGGKGITGPQPMQVQPPPPPHMSQLKQDKLHSVIDMGHDAQGFGWRHENHDNFGDNQE
ncbi:hypothetical protein SLA2020_260060 [Shorea laevis]